MIRPFSSDFREIVLYALNPLTIISVAGEGHLESILVFWIMLSLYGCRQKKPWLMYPALGLAVMTKLTPVIFLPLLVERGNLKYFPLFLLPFALMLPYVDPGIDFLSSLKIFISDFHFNGLFNYIQPGHHRRIAFNLDCHVLRGGSLGFCIFSDSGQTPVCLPVIRHFIDFCTDISYLVSAADYPVSRILPLPAMDHSSSDNAAPCFLFSPMGHPPFMAQQAAASGN